MLRLGICNSYSGGEIADSKWDPSHCKHFLLPHLTASFFLAHIHVLWSGSSWCAPSWLLLFTSLSGTLFQFQERVHWVLLDFSSFYMFVWHTMPKSSVVFYGPFCVKLLRHQEKIEELEQQNALLREGLNSERDIGNRAIQDHYARLPNLHQPSDRAICFSCRRRARRRTWQCQSFDASLNYIWE